MFSETTYSSQTNLIGLNLLIRERRIGYSNLTPDPQGARGALGVKIQVSPNQKTSLTKVVRDDKNFVSPSGGARKTREAGFLVILIRELNTMDQKEHIFSCYIQFSKMNIDQLSNKPRKIGFFDRAKSVLKMLPVPFL